MELRCLFVAFYSFVVSIHMTYCDEEFDGQLTLLLQHSFDSGPSPEFTPRGSITINSLKTGSVQLPTNVQLSETELANLKALVAQDGFYRIRIPIKTDVSFRYLSTFLKACSLYESGLRDSLTLHRDSNGDFIGISASTPVPNCMGTIVSPEDLQYFNTVIEVRSSEIGPQPATSAFIEKMEREKERAKNEPQDNRSFFAKYWMYILPVVILIFISGTSNPEQGGGR